MLGATSSVAEFDEVCTQFKQTTLGTTFMAWLQGLYTIPGKPRYSLIRLVKALLHVSTYCNSAYNSGGKNSHTLTKAGLHIFT